jgi:RNA polymerase sigma factor (TIGR02999 family)
MAREKPGHTLDATSLVHEAYLRLVRSEDGHRWESRGHFFAAAAESMRRILVDSARRKARVRHGGNRMRMPLPDHLAREHDNREDLVALSDALDQLSASDAQAAELVKLHYFAGLTIEQSATILGVSTRKAYHVWAFARAWLYRALGGEGAAGS